MVAQRQGITRPVQILLGTRIWKWRRLQHKASSPHLSWIKESKPIPGVNSLSSIFWNLSKLSIPARVCCYKWNYIHVEQREPVATEWSWLCWYVKTSNEYIKPENSPLYNLIIMFPPRPRCSSTLIPQFDESKNKLVLATAWNKSECRDINPYHCSSISRGVSYKECCRNSREYMQ